MVLEVLIVISVPRCGSLSVIYLFPVNTHNNQAIYVCVCVRVCMFTLESVVAFL
jgi:hypothetical protein